MTAGLAATGDSSVPPQEAEEIRGLLEYPEDTAGGLMTRDLLAVRSNHTAARAISQLRERAHERDDFYTIFVVEPDGHLAGIVTLQDLVLADPSTRISELVKDPPAVVTVDMDQEEVGRILARYNLPSIGVVDGEGRLVGRITFDDVIDVVEAETTEDILRFAAVSEVESLRGSTLGAVRSRLPWLALNLLTAVAASSVVYVFQSTIERLAILAAVMPVIAGMGGNAGTQALAVTSRRRRRRWGSSGRSCGRNSWWVSSTASSSGSSWPRWPCFFRTRPRDWGSW